jgi:hypothetical protein
MNNEDFVRHESQFNDSLNSPGAPHPFVSHQWEELVAKLCDSDDPHLRKIGHYHRANLEAGKGRSHPPES